MPYCCPVLVANVYDQQRLLYAVEATSPDIDLVATTENSFNKRIANQRLLNQVSIRKNTTEADNIHPLLVYALATICNMKWCLVINSIVRCRIG